MTHGAGLFLVSTVAGYWVLERAETHKGSLKKLGRFLGWDIIIGGLCGAVRSITCWSGMMGGSKRGWCPIMSPRTSPSMDTESGDTESGATTQ